MEQIYIGPSIKGTILNTFTIFADGIPNEYKDSPTFGKLFVKPENLESARKEIKKKGSYFNILYQKALKGAD